jgi:hypothetical protein
VSWIVFVDRPAHAEHSDCMLHYELLQKNSAVPVIFWSLPKSNPGDTDDRSATMEPASRCFKIFNCHVAMRDATLLRPLNKTRSTLSLS